MCMPHTCAFVYLCVSITFEYDTRITHEIRAHICIPTACSRNKIHCINVLVYDILCAVYKYFVYLFLPCKLLRRIHTHTLWVGLFVCLLPLVLPSPSPPSSSFAVRLLLLLLFSRQPFRVLFVLSCANAIVIVIIICLLILLSIYKVYMNRILSIPTLWIRFGFFALSLFLSLFLSFHSSSFEFLIFNRFSPCSIEPKPIQIHSFSKLLFDNNNNTIFILSMYWNWQEKIN